MYADRKDIEDMKLLAVMWGRRLGLIELKSKPSPEPQREEAVQPSGTGDALQKEKLRFLNVLDSMLDDKDAFAGSEMGGGLQKLEEMCTVTEDVGWPTDRCASFWDVILACFWHQPRNETKKEKHKLMFSRRGFSRRVQVKGTTEIPSEFKRCEVAPVIGSVLFSPMNCGKGLNAQSRVTFVSHLAPVVIVQIEGENVTAVPAHVQKLVKDNEELRQFYFTTSMNNLYTFQGGSFSSEHVALGPSLPKFKNLVQKEIDALSGYTAVQQKRK